MRRVLAGVGAGAVALALTACSGSGGGTAELGVEAAVTSSEGTSASGAETAAPDTAAAAASLVLPAGPRVVQTASLGLTVGRGDFGDTVNRARTLVAGLGGYVTSSSASQGSEKRLVSGSLVIRVPADAYSRAMASLTKLGRVESRDESGQDVSGEFIDLQARKRHLEAVEAQLLGFLKRTRTVPEALAVQSRLDDVQLRLEEVRGQLIYLDDRTSFATITLLVSERGAPIAAPGDGDGWSITDAWHAAAHGLVQVAGGALVALVVAGPILLVLAALTFLGRLAFRRHRAHAEPRSTAG